MKVDICENHLAELYAAVKEGDLKRMGIIEHELTSEEKCVACAYVFKTRGTVKEALETFLGGEGMEVDFKPATEVKNEIGYWGIRLFVLSVVFGVVVFTSVLLKRFVIHQVLSFSLIDLTVICLTAVILFVVIDDKFLD